MSILIRPRLTEYHGIPVAQAEIDFAIPFLDEDIPLYVDPFLLWKSPSMADQALHTSVIAAFNHLGSLATTGQRDAAVSMLVELSECAEVGLGAARNRQGRRIGQGTAVAILDLFLSVPQIERGGLRHLEELQLLVEQISRDRVSDIACSLLKSHLVDYTIDQCQRLGIPRQRVEMNVFDLRRRALVRDTVDVPVNPETGAPILFVPKRWLRYMPWINLDDYFDGAHIVGEDAGLPRDRIAVLNYNRQNYDQVLTYLAAKERTQEDCKNDPLFKPIPVLSVRRTMADIKRLPTGTGGNADKKYEDAAVRLLASMLYPHLDFAADQSRTDSGALIRDLVFYNSCAVDFLSDIHRDYGSRQLVFELKNVAKVEREHVNQINRYMAGSFGKFGVMVTRNPLPRAVFRNTVDLWSGQRRCVLALTDADLEQMVTVFESRQRMPVEVLKRAYIEFMRACPS